MSSNLIFHVVSKRKWHEFNKGGYYTPRGKLYEDGIICVSADQLKSHINQNFKGRRKILVLILDKARLVNKPEMDNENNWMVIKDRINMDAVLDKIRLSPDKDGLFDIEVEEDA